MLLLPGQRYQLAGKSQGHASRLHPSWLVAAVRGAWPSARVLRVTPGDRPLIDIQVTRPTTIEPGESIVPLLDSVSSPGFESPTIVVEDVRPTDPGAAAVERALDISDVERATPPWGKLALSVAMIGFTAVAITRIARKGS